MTLVPFNKSDIDKIEVKIERKIKLVDTILSFITSEHDCVEITDYPYGDAMACRSAFGMTIKRLGLLGVKVRMKGYRVFLIKEQ